MPRPSPATADSRPVTLSELADKLKLKASGRDHVYRLVKRLGVKPVQRAGRVGLYPPGTIDLLRAELGKGGAR